MYRGEDNDVYQTEHDELFASIRSGKPINNGEYMAKSTFACHHGAHGHLHGSGDYLGHGSQLQGSPRPREVRVGPGPPPYTLPCRD